MLEYERNLIMKIHPKIPSGIFAFLYIFIVLIADNKLNTKFFGSVPFYIIAFVMVLIIWKIFGSWYDDSNED